MIRTDPTTRRRPRLQDYRGYYDEFTCAPVGSLERTVAEPFGYTF